MYAEQFNAPSWLEEPSRWLWWAMQSRIAGKLEDAQYNLQQFWQALGVVKATATEATWPEILALDSQSHIQAANITGAIISQMEKDYNTASAWIRFFSGTIFKSWNADQSKNVSAAIARMQDQRKAELVTAAELADRAGNAMGERVQAVVDGRISGDEAERAQENRTLSSIINAYRPEGEIPMWAWVAGAIGLLVLIYRR